MLPMCYDSMLFHVDSLYYGRDSVCSERRSTYSALIFASLGMNKPTTQPPPSRYTYYGTEIHCFTKSPSLHSKDIRASAGPMSCSTLFAMHASMQPTWGILKALLCMLNSFLRGDVLSQWAAKERTVLAVIVLSPMQVLRESHVT